MSMFSVSGSTAVLDSAAFSVSRRGSTRIGSSLPYQVSSSLLAIAVCLQFPFSQCFKLTYQVGIYIFVRSGCPRF